MGGNHWLSHHLSTVIAPSENEHELSASIEWILMGISVAIAVIAILFAVSKYKKHTDEEPTTALGKFFYNKWYIDELYNTAIVEPLNKLAGFLKEVVEKVVIDGAVNGIGKSIQFAARKTRLVQNGQVGFYILMMVIGMVVMLLLWFNDTALLKLFSNLLK
jgi:NADH-quinone oxidoreductase subunit L